jgi:hypothetical protein
MCDDLVAVIPLNDDDAFLCGTARAAQALERFRRFVELALYKSGNHRHHTRAAPLAKHAYYTVIRDTILHAKALRQARNTAPPNARAAMAKKIGIFCGAHTGNNERYIEIAAHTARRLVAEGFGIVYGGGRVGLMGVIADNALEAGGEVIGVIPESLASREIAHSGLTQLRVVATMHERKALMADLSDGFIAIPGGYGTMDEFCEVVTWAQLRIHAKPVALLNSDGYYDELLALFDKMVREGFLSLTNRSIVRSARTIEELLPLMQITTSA